MRHNLCRSFHPWCPGVKNRCLCPYGTVICLQYMLMKDKASSDVIYIFNDFSNTRVPENGRHFANIFKFSLIEIFLIWVKISLKSFPEFPIDNKSLMVNVMAWCRICNKPLIEPLIIQSTDTYMRHLVSMCSNDRGNEPFTLTDGPKWRPLKMR